MNLFLLYKSSFHTNKNIVIHHLDLLKKKGFQPDPVHDVRVAIKKLTASLELFNGLKVDDASFELQATRTFFKILGKCRQWDIVLENLERFRMADTLLIPEFIRHINRSRKEITLKCKSFLADYSVSDLCEIESRLNELETTAEFAITGASVAELIKRKFAKVKQLKRRDDADIHYLRKELKTVYYWLLWWSENELLSKRSLVMLDDFLEKAGYWHDLEDMGEIIRNFRHYYLANTNEEQRALKNLEQDIDKKRKKLFRSISQAAIVKHLEIPKI